MADAIMLSGLPQLTNYMAGIEFNSGYYNTSGGVSRASSERQEVYSETYFNFADFSDKLIIISVPAISSVPDLWAGFCKYDSDKSFISQVNMDNMAASYVIGDRALQVFSRMENLSDGSFFRVSFRGYGDPYIYAVDQTELLNCLK